ncbi:MAG: SIS domain-containing protein [Candidatus Beckwithbacteria bacterium]|nr:SIS domain-containing protein [Candidatus Beckwithbacteria bacterium]
MNLDPLNVFGSLKFFPEQCFEAWQESSKIKFPPKYQSVKNIVVCGMGGSRFTPKTVKELFRDRITLPYEIVEDYTLPAYANADTLVILSSYSGTTEEVISCAQEAVKKSAQIIQISSRKIIDVPGYIFNPQKFNPCGQPRIGAGYLLFGHMGLLHSLGLLKIDEAEIMAAINFIRQQADRLVSQAQKLAPLLKDRHPFIITAEFLKGFGNGFANQINENAKMISDYRYISELNHHLMEGLKYPASLKKTALFIFINSKFYTPRIQKRFALTQDVVKQQSIATASINLTGPSKLTQVLEAFTLSGFATYYLSQLYGINPASIPWVDYFKKQLEK